MTLEELKDGLDALNIPCAYRHFKSSKVACPKVVFYVDTYQQLGTDNRVGESVNHIIVDLYTTYKDLDTEADIEELFDTFYTKDEDYIDEEGCVRVEYTL